MSTKTEERTGTLEAKFRWKQVNDPDLARATAKRNPPARVEVYHLYLWDSVVGSVCVQYRPGKNAFRWSAFAYGVEVKVRDRMRVKAPRGYTIVIMRAQEAVERVVKGGGT